LYIPTSKTRRFTTRTLAPEEVGDAHDLVERTESAFAAPPLQHESVNRSGPSRRRALRGLKGAILDSLPAPVRRILRIVRRRTERFLSRSPELARLSELAAHLDGVEVVSCDLFDTLVQRDVEPPEVLKRAMASYVEKHLGQKGFAVTRDKFLTTRLEEERRLRHESWQRGGDPECTLSAIARSSLLRLFDAAIACEHAEALVRHELEVECRHLEAAPGALDLLRALEASGRRVVITSDTYLEPPHLEHLLGKTGIAGHVRRIYASSEFSLGKYSGGLFRCVLEREAVPASRLLHFGDNFDADVRGARRAGVRGLLLFDRDRVARRRRLARVTRLELVTGGAWEY
jgi:FMN phosphatase YigB (HAD superfamily)